LRLNRGWKKAAGKVEGKQEIYRQIASGVVEREGKMKSENGKNFSENLSHRIDFPLKINRA
jgi:hypothetical protein